MLMKAAFGLVYIARLVPGFVQLDHKMYVFTFRAMICGVFEQLNLKRWRIATNVTFHFDGDHTSIVSLNFLCLLLNKL